MFPQSLRDSRKLSKLFVSLSLGLAAIGSAQAATYYVRVDGGDASQCNGRADAAYPGTGTGTAQTIPVYGDVPGQTTPAAGTYRDTVTATITY